MIRELFYSIDYWEGDNNPPEVVNIRVQEEKADELIRVLKAVLKSGRNETGNKDQDRYEYVADMLDKYVREAGGLWSYVPMDGTFYID